MASAASVRSGAHGKPHLSPTAHFGDARPRQDSAERDAERTHKGDLVRAARCAMSMPGNLDANARARLIAALRRLPPTLKLSHVDWSVIVSALRAGAVPA